ncbi:MAG: hypothetical protein AAFZ01_00915 [Pseudomonadota bacterium]
MSKRGLKGGGAPAVAENRWVKHWAIIWFHVIGAGLLTLPQLVLGGENAVCHAWDVVNMAGTTTLGCASKTYLALLIMLSALWLSLFSVSGDAEVASTEARNDTLQMPGLTARFAVFFAMSMIFLETVAFFSLST